MSFPGTRVSLLAAAALFASIASAEPAAKTEQYSRETAKTKYRRPAAIPFPKDNPYSPEKDLLGRTLFFDTRLSNSRSTSCASCHNPGFAWGDGLPLAVGAGMKTLGRRSPTILNLAWADLLFWDGRAGSLEEQALGPISAPGEMNMPIEKMIKSVEDISEYRPLFAAAFPGKPISADLVAKAIATFERTVVSAKAPFDHWIEGDEKAISDSAKRGFDLFNTKAACAKCHEGWNFTDNGFHDIGVDDKDLGRGVHLKLPAMQHAFKTPTLRNVDRRAPYLHNGSEATLEKVIDFYNDGGRVKRPSLAEEVFKLELTTEEKKDLVSFLKTLTSQDKPIEIPNLPVN